MLSVFREHAAFTRSLAHVLCFTMAVVPTGLALAAEGSGSPAPADKDFGALAESAKTFGQEGYAAVPQPSIVGTHLDLGNGATLDTNELYPGTSGAAPPNSSYFSNQPSVEDLKKVFDQGSAMNSSGTNAKDALYQDSQANPPSVAGMAYGMALKASSKYGSNFENDPFLAASQQVYANMDVFEGNFTDCQETEEIVDAPKTAHVPDYKTCEKVYDRSGECDAVHTYQASVIQHYSGPVNLMSCGEGCLDLWIGKVGDNYWGGNCKIFEEETVVQVINPEAITSAIFERAKWDDYMQVYIGPVGQETKIWQGPNANFPPETAGACELNTSWDQNPNVDVTNEFKQGGPGAIVRFKIRVSVTGNGEGYGRIRIHYDPSRTISADKWEPDDCIERAKGLADGFAKGAVTCTDDPSDANGCVSVDGVTVCNDDLAPAPFPGIPALCRKVHVKADYDFNKGQMECYTDADGKQQCPVNTGGNNDTCQEYENDASCGFISSKCLDGAEGKSGQCYVQTATYDCGKDVPYADLGKQTKYKCSGPIACMGDECLKTDKEQSQDFAKAVALMNVAQFMTEDMACTGQDASGNVTGLDNVNCKVFEGQALTCKKAVGGMQNCCKNPSSISLADYLTLMMTVPKIDSAVMSLDNGNAVKGAYQVLREPIMDSWSTVTKPFSSYIENITGAYEKITGAMKSYAEDAITALEKKVSEMMAKIFGESAGTGAAGAAAGGGVQEGSNMATTTATESAKALVNAAGTFLTVVSWAYTAYVVTTIAVQMAFKCKQSEFELGAKRAMKSCHEVGSYCDTKVLGACIEEKYAYCCYNSPLSRILQEQVAPQFDRHFGDAKNPQCGGLAIAQLAEVDWSQVDLSEWIGILQDNNHWPDATKLTIEAMTGANSALDASEYMDDGTPRQNAADRAISRFSGIDGDAERQKAADKMYLYTGAPTDNPNLTDKP